MFIQVCSMYLAMVGMIESSLPFQASQGLNYAEAGEFDKAINAWSVLLAVAPEQEEYWFCRGMAHGALGHSEAMHHDMAQCFKLYPADAYSEYLLIDEEDESGEAEAQYNALLKRHPHCAHLLFAYGRFLAIRGRYKEGLILLNKSIHYKPRNNDAYHIRAAVLAHDGKNELAEQDLRLYLAWKPDDTSVQITQTYLKQMKDYYRKTIAKQFEQTVKERVRSERAVLDLKQTQSRWDQVIQRNDEVVLSDSDDVQTFDSGCMKIPITLTDEYRQQAMLLTLYVSTNQGKDWQKAATALLEDKDFSYTAPADGRYWFSVAYTTSNGSQVPGTIAELQPLLKVRINTALAYQKTTEKQSQVVASSTTNIALPSSMLPPKR